MPRKHNAPVELDHDTEDKRAAFLEQFEALGLTYGELAKRLIRLGDHREQLKLTLRRIGRGTTEVPDDLLLVLDLMNRQRRRLQRAYGHLMWTKSDDKQFARAEGYLLTLWPKRRMAPRISVVHEEGGYNPPYVEWPGTIKKAKHAALVALDDALSYVDREREEDPEYRF